MSKGAPNYPNTTLYVGDLHHAVTEGILFDKFSRAGKVTSIRVCRHVITRRSLGYAYVNFREPAGAEYALKTMNFELIMGRPIRIMWSQRESAVRKSGMGNVVVKNLEKSIDHQALYNMFSRFGNILSCKVACDDGGSKGHGFVHFETLEAAENAINEMTGALFNNRKVFVEHFKSYHERAKETGDKEKDFTNIYIKNFGKDLNERRLKETFEKYGPTVSVRVMTDNNGNSKGFGFVSYQRHRDAKRAVDNMNGTEINGRRIYVARAQRWAERQLELEKQETMTTKVAAKGGYRQIIKSLHEEDCLAQQEDINIQMMANKQAQSNPAMTLHQPEPSLSITNIQPCKPPVIGPCQPVPTPAINSHQPLQKSAMTNDQPAPVNKQALSNTVMDIHQPEPSLSITNNQPALVMNPNHPAIGPCQPVPTPAINSHQPLQKSAMTNDQPAPVNKQALSNTVMDIHQPEPSLSITNNQPALVMSPNHPAIGPCQPVSIPTINSHQPEQNTAITNDQPAPVNEQALSNTVMDIHQPEPSLSITNNQPALVMNPNHPAIGPCQPVSIPTINSHQPEQNTAITNDQPAPVNEQALSNTVMDIHQPEPSLSITNNQPALVMNPNHPAIGPCQPVSIPTIHSHQPKQNTAITNDQPVPVNKQALFNPAMNLHQPQLSLPVTNYHHALHAVMNLNQLQPNCLAHNYQCMPCICMQCQPMLPPVFGRCQPVPIPTINHYQPVLNSAMTNNQPVRVQTINYQPVPIQASVNHQSLPNLVINHQPEPKPTVTIDQHVLNLANTNDQPVLNSANTNDQSVPVQTINYEPVPSPAISYQPLQHRAFYPPVPNMAFSPCQHVPNQAFGYNHPVPCPRMNPYQTVQPMEDFTATIPQAWNINAYNPIIQMPELVPCPCWSHHRMWPQDFQIFPGAPCPQADYFRTTIPPLAQVPDPMTYQKLDSHHFTYATPISGVTDFGCAAGVDDSQEHLSTQITSEQPTIPEPLTASFLASLSPEDQKQILSHRLYPLIRDQQLDVASKITGMLLELDNSEILQLLQSSESLHGRMDEAIGVLQAFRASEAAATGLANKASQDNHAAGYHNPVQQNINPPHQDTLQQPAVPVLKKDPLTISYVAGLSPEDRHQTLGQHLYSLILGQQPDLASKITGMLLELEDTEILKLLESAVSLQAKVNEAVSVLQDFWAQEAAKKSTATNANAEEAMMTKANAEATATTKANADITATTKANAEVTATTKANAEATATTKANAEATATTKVNAEATATTKVNAGVTATTKVNAEVTETTKANAGHTATTKANAKKNVMSKANSGRAVMSKANSKKTLMTIANEEHTVTTKDNKEEVVVNEVDAVQTEMTKENAEQAMMTKANAEATATTKANADITATTKVNADITATTKVNADITATTKVNADITATTKVNADKTATTKVNAGVTATTKVNAEVTETTKANAEHTATTKANAKKNVMSKANSKKTVMTIANEEHTVTTKDNKEEVVVNEVDAVQTEMTKANAEATATTKANADVTATTKVNAEVTETTKANAGHTATTKANAKKNVMSKANSGRAVMSKANSKKTVMTIANEEHTVTTKDNKEEVVVNEVDAVQTEMTKENAKETESK